MTEPVTFVRDKVKDHYAAAARAAAAGQTACCGDEPFGDVHYDNLGDLPEGARRASLGCGNPTAVADLHDGDVVLDLGSGGGIDVLLSARRVGPTGRVYGLDMTPDMLELARRNAAEAGATNVEFLEGHIEQIPLPDHAVDVVISNCVVNLSEDKTGVFTEMHRVLRPGGRIGISDVVADDDLTPADRAALGSHESCIAGALSVSEYRQGLVAAGFADVDIVVTYDIGHGMHGAIVTAVAGPGVRTVSTRP
jgi:SAM-dependent methyltransferase